MNESQSHTPENDSRPLPTNDLHVLKNQITPQENPQIKFIKSVIETTNNEIKYELKNNIDKKYSRLPQNDGAYTFVASGFFDKDTVESVNITHILTTRRDHGEKKSIESVTKYLQKIKKYQRVVNYRWYPTDEDPGRERLGTFDIQNDNSRDPVDAEKHLKDIEDRYRKKGLSIKSYRVIDYDCYRENWEYLWKYILIRPIIRGPYA